MEGNYLIIDELGKKNIHSLRVYRLEEVDSKKELILKVYDNSRSEYYQNEHDILAKLNNNYPSNEQTDFFIMYKNIQLNQINLVISKKIYNNIRHVLFYDYLKGLSLFDYMAEAKEKIKENHAKYLCYKLLKSIEKLHYINICHNNIDVEKIMFDEKFNLKLIDYSEAKVIENNQKIDQLNYDIFCIGQTIAKVISLGTLHSIVYNEETKINEIFTNAKTFGKRKKYVETEFWNKIDLMFSIKASEDFLKFLKILVDAKSSKEKIDISTLLNNKWLEDVVKDANEYENKFKANFEEFYNAIIEDNILNSSIKIKVDNFLDECQNEAFIIASEDNIGEISNDYHKENEEYYINKNEQNKFDNKYDKKILNEIDNLNINNQNHFKPRKDDFNYLEINIENKENKDVETALKTFMKDYRDMIYKKEEYKDQNTVIDIQVEKDTSFIIKYEILPIKLNDKEKIIFLDKNFEKRIKNKQEFEIKVELIDGDKSLFEKNKINQYYLIFSGVSIYKDDLYYNLKILKNIAKSLLNE